MRKDWGALCKKRQEPASAGWGTVEEAGKPSVPMAGGERSRKGLCSKRPAAAAKSLQSCPTLCDPIDGSPPGSPVPGILQARTLEWV